MFVFCFVMKASSAIRVQQHDEFKSCAMHREFSPDTMTAAVCAAIPAEQRSKSLQLVTAAAI
jgi:hypothetical protein